MQSPAGFFLQERHVQIAIDTIVLAGDLVVPAQAHGVIVFAHGSGSSRHSLRNRFVARTLQERGFATLLMDLLTTEEEQQEAQTGMLRFDIDLLAHRLVGAMDWLAHNPETKTLLVGCFGASTGAGAALTAATERPGTVFAVVSRGGRPDLAGKALPHVLVPTLLIVGENDLSVIPLNEETLAHLGAAEKKLEIVPGATHLFEEAGALEVVARLAADWFEFHLPHTP